MKTLKVNGQIVQLNNAHESDELTPAMARSAVRMLYGHLTQANVIDDKRGYMVSTGRTVEMTAEQLWDAGIEF